MRSRLLVLLAAVATGSGTWPIPPGKYDVHDLLDDGDTSLAVAPLTVTK
jgi:hypothetical protein